MKTIAAIICITLLAGAAHAGDSPELNNLAIASIRSVPYLLRYSETNPPVVGSHLLGLKVVNVTTSTVTLTREDGRTVSLVRGRPITEQEFIVRFVDVANRTLYPTTRVGKEFNVGTQRFICTSINTNDYSCTLRDVDSGELLTITNKLVQQSVPAYPPQGVGSADP